MKSQAYAAICHDGPCFPSLQPIRDFFASGSRVFSVRKLLSTFFNYQILGQGLGLMFLVLLTVTIPPHISTNAKIIRASVSDRLVWENIFNIQYC